MSAPLKRGRTHKKVGRPRVGDVFEIPAGPGLHVYGQVLARDLRTYLVVAFRTVETDLEQTELTLDDVGLAGIVFDAKLINGDWPIIANRPVPQYSEPLFVSGHEDFDGVELVSFDGRMRREAQNVEAAAHRTRHLSSPMRF